MSTHVALRPTQPPLQIGITQRPIQNNVNRLYVDALERLKTYPLTWSSAHSKQFLVGNGFFFYSNQIVCAFCNGSFEDHSNLLDSHKDRSPECSMTGDIPLGDLTNLRYERHRLATILLCKNWTAPVSPYDLARFGFFWTGISDLTKCAFCRLEVRNWEPTDTADGEHRRWNADCPFMRGRFVANVPIGRETEDMSHLYDIAEDVVGITNNTVHRTNGAAFVSNNELGITKFKEAQHPEYRDLTARLKSFELWPPSLKQTPEELATAGFYYTTIGDRVICYQCNVGLHNWAIDDDPWEEHAKWAKECPFVLLMKGKQFVDEMKSKKMNEEGSNMESETSETSVALTAVNQTASIMAIDNKNDDSMQKNGQLCKICFQNQLELVHLPCAHLSTCASCGMKMDKCPLCRSDIHAYIRVYLP